jgi:hypothetical protein
MDIIGSPKEEVLYTTKDGVKLYHWVLDYYSEDISAVISSLKEDINDNTKSLEEIKKAKSLLLLLTNPGFHRVFNRK